MAKNDEAQAVAIPASATAMIEPTPELLEQAYDAVLNGTPMPEVGDPNVTAKAIQERIVYADNFADVFTPQSLTPWSNYLDESVVVHGFHLNPSTFEQGSSVYAVVSIAHKDTGVVETVSVGGGNVLVQLLKAWEQSWFPISVKLISKRTGGGNDTYWLEKA